MAAKARVLRHSGRRQAQEKECPDWRDWRTEAHCLRTFFLLGYRSTTPNGFVKRDASVRDPCLRVTEFGTLAGEASATG
jgi:hypothetical protein